MSMNTPEPPPNPSSATPCWDLVLADIAERDAMGTAKYGQRLTPGDGRDSLVDAYQEALDLTVYLRKALAERAPCWTGGHIPADGMVLVDASRLRKLVVDDTRATLLVPVLERRIADLDLELARMRASAAMGDEHGQRKAFEAGLVSDEPHTHCSGCGNAFEVGTPVQVDRPDLHPWCSDVTIPPPPPDMDPDDLRRRVDALLEGMERPTCATVGGETGSQPCRVFDGEDWEALIRASSTADGQVAYLTTETKCLAPPPPHTEAP